jgi:hypothetical protein
LPRGLGHAEVDHLWHRLPIVQGDEHIGWLEVAVDDALLMRMLDGLANGDEEFQPLAGSKVMLVAVLGDRHALDKVHDDVRPAGARCAGVEHAGDVGVVHQGQSLPLGPEAGDDLLRVQAGLDELDGHQPLDRLGLLGHPDRAHAAFADKLNELVGTDDGAGGFVCRHKVGGIFNRPRRRREEIAGLGVGFQQQFHAVAQLTVAAAGLVEERGTLLGRWLLQGFQENGCFVHCATPPGLSELQRQCAVGEEMTPEKSVKNYSSASPTMRR